jgi:hypothetical protein
MVVQFWLSHEIILYRARKQHAAARAPQNLIRKNTAAADALQDVASRLDVGLLLSTPVARAAYLPLFSETSEQAALVQQQQQKQRRKCIEQQKEGLCTYVYTQ